MKNYFAFFVSCHPFFVFIYFFFTSISRHAFAPRWLLVSAWRNSVVNDGKIWCYFIGLFLTYFEQDFSDPRVLMMLDITWMVVTLKEGTLLWNLPRG